MSVMQPYQNFQQNLPQFQNMGYPQQSVNFPYMDRMNYLQSVQQNLQQPNQMYLGLNGKIVDSLESIMANDVPMDIPFSIFPKRDLSEISVKYWTGEGKIATINFKPINESELQKPKEITSNDFNLMLEAISEKVDNLSNRLDEVLKTKTNTKNKKEVTLDE